MLRHLRVTNFAILSDVAIDLGPGLNVLTGETGAGKSLIVDAVSLLRGGRASSDIPRAGTDEAVVEAMFDVPADLVAQTAAILDEAGLPEGGDEVCVRRVISRGGKSRTYINGALTTAARLAALGAHLIDLSGQHQHQSLVDPRRHRMLVDAFAGSDAAVAAMAEAYAALAEARGNLEAALGDPAARADRLDYLDFQLAEIEAANLSPGEDENLATELSRLAAADKLETAARLAESLLYSGDAAAADHIGRASRELVRVADSDPALAAIVTEIDEASALCEDAARALADYADRITGDPDRLAEVQDRLDQIARLSRKHGGTVAAVIARGEALARERAELSDSEGRAEDLRRALESARKNAEAKAAALTKIRRRAAGKLCAEAGRAIAELGMANAALAIAVEPKNQLSETGADHVEILLAANRGEAQKPLARIASGGELSRIMLALKLSLRRADDVATYVFDEVDTGIGGATADAVGRQIRAVADARQVICVTHLPQIAAFADAHFQVAKLEHKGRTETLVARLEDGDRAMELARMLGGARVTARARAHADEMLAAARAR
ncbi:MAG TPA: DNA repair protein RecN [Kofleriaceae bacterium]|nr:DNA repair protein RecN [Kofleriaceae bacterium]